MKTWTPAKLYSAQIKLLIIGVYMARMIEGQLNAEGKKFGIVVSRFNEMISKSLLSGAFDCLARHGANEDEITVAFVPGSFEIPMTAKKMAESKKYDAVICLGAVIRAQLLILIMLRQRYQKELRVFLWIAVCL